METSRRAYWLISAGLTVVVEVAACASQTPEVIPGTSQEGGVADGAMKTPCQILGDCCPTLPSEVVESCQRLSMQAASSSCSDELVALKKVGECSQPDAGAAHDASKDATGSTAHDAGKTGSSADASVACILLNACCTSSGLPAGDSANCTSIQGSGDEKECNATLASLVASDDCGPAYPGDSCGELQSCCSSEMFPQNFYGPCLDVVDIGVKTGINGCDINLTMFENAGFCGATIQEADGGKVQDPECTALALCCEGINFPPGLDSTCAEIVQGNEGGNCDSAYESYVALNYCAEQ